MYIITRADLAPGYQAVQSAHATVQFGFEHTQIYKVWYENSNYLGLLSVANEEALRDLIDQAKNHDIKVSVFREPDIDDQITAIALEPGSKTKRLCSKLPLALKDKNEKLD